VILKPVDDIYSLWPWVRQGLERCATKTAERYRPEDVYLMLQAKTAHLYVCEEKAQPIGFVVVQRLQDPDGPVLFIFAAWGALRDVDDAVYVELEKLARSIGAKRIRMQSPRRAWLREKFFRAVTTIFEHEL
jgi:hypothetical protein